MNLRRYSFPLLALALAGTASASTEATLFGTTFTVDTVSHYMTAPGVTYSNLKFTSPSQWFTAHAVTFDLDRTENVELKVETACETCNTTERITAIGKRKTTDTHRPVAAINGDFFITSSFAKNHVLGNKILGYPNTTSVTGGKIVSPDAIDAASVINALVINDKGEMWIDQTDMSYDFIGPNKTSRVKIYHANYPLQAGEIVLYNSFYGKTTQTSPGACELTLELAEGETWGLNRDIIMKVTKEATEEGNIAIPENGAVISADPARTAQIRYIKNNLTVGAEVKVRVMASLPSYDNLQPQGITEIIGGDVKILREGVASTINCGDRFINACNSAYSRSMIGYSQDRKKLVICVTDRGATTSKLTTVGYGTSYPQGGDLMKFLGCYEALNFDGGGSTLLWTADKAIVNEPRDGSERAVGNGFFAYLNTPVDNNITEIRFADPAKTLERNATYSPAIFGYNKYGELISKNITGFTLTCPAQLGSVKGTSLNATGTGSHAITATYNGMTATMPVRIAGTYDGISEITADNDSNVEFFNLSGVKIDNPGQGVYVARKGNSVEKILINR